MRAPTSRIREEPLEHALVKRAQPFARRDDEVVVRRLDQIAAIPVGRFAGACRIACGRFELDDVDANIRRRIPGDRFALEDQPVIARRR